MGGYTGAVSGQRLSKHAPVSEKPTAIIFRIEERLGTERTSGKRGPINGVEARYLRANIYQTARRHIYIHAVIS
jgi:hypothetical protein